ncbi:helix-turn-helix domain-containing protein [Thaumasiovibrio subtropicus]|uniref:helix-turn-helix domain-containing protein n=1 Tax=Thaumasiovibrio subtropicus TaxID=1891207 RepID=UPI000B35D960|nr:helix-turn-helix domain-containing protein [Thaumasiovibrio subtropicus]
MNKVLRAAELIESRLPEILSLDEIAAHCYASKWHLQRSFKKVTGLSIGQYQRYRALSLAGLEVAEDKYRILDIALKYGFESQEAFARAFRRFANVAPRNLRGNHTWARIITLPKIDEQLLARFDIYRAMQPTKRAFPAQRWAVYVEQFENSRSKDTDIEGQIDQMWQRFDQRPETANLTCRQLSVLEFWQLDYYTSGLFPMGIAYQVEDGEPVPDDMVIVDVPAREAWEFELPDRHHIQSFFIYFYVLWIKEQEGRVGVPPIIWNGGDSGAVTAYIPWLDEADVACPPGMQGEPQLQNQVHETRLVREVDISECQKLGSHIITAVLSTLLDAPVNAMIERVYFSDTDAENAGVFGIYIDHLDNDKMPVNQEDTSLIFEKGRCLVSHWQGSLQEIAKGLETYLHHYIWESKYYYIPGVSIVENLTRDESGRLSFTLFTPVKYRRG